MKKILVVGGGAYQVPLIKRIRELGYKVYCVDRDENAPGFEFANGYRAIDVTNEIECLEYAKKLGIDGVMTYGATVTLSTVSYIGQKMGLPAPKYETAEISRNKYKIKKRLYDFGLNIFGEFFNMIFPDNGENHRFTFPCVVKPSDGSGSRGVSIVRKKDELYAAVKNAYANARYGEIYVESFIDGDEYSVEAFVCGGQTYIYVIVKTTFERDENGKVTYGHMTALDLPYDKEKEIKIEIEKAVEALNITMGSVNFDIIFHGSRAYIIDCGIRAGQNLIASHLVPLSRGVNVMDNAIYLSLGEAVDAEPKYRRCIATRLLIYEPGIITEIKSTGELKGKNGIIDIILTKKAGDKQNEYTKKSDICGWVVAGGATPAEAEKNAQKAKEALKEYIIIKPFGDRHE